jgi:hypothetical protein
MPHMDTHATSNAAEQPEPKNAADRRSKPDERDRIVRALTEAFDRDFDELFAPPRAA